MEYYCYKQITVFSPRMFFPLTVQQYPEPQSHLLFHRFSQLLTPNQERTAKLSSLLSVLRNSGHQESAELHLHSSAAEPPQLGAKNTESAAPSFPYDVILFLNKVLIGMCNEWVFPWQSAVLWASGGGH